MYITKHGKNIFVIQKKKMTEDKDGTFMTGDEVWTNPVWTIPCRVI